MQAAGVGLLTMDYVANTATPNEKAAEIWGLASLEPVALRSLYDHFHPDDLTEIERKIEESLDSRGSGAVDLDFRILRAEGWATCLFRRSGAPIWRHGRCRCDQAEIGGNSDDA